MGRSYGGVNAKGIAPMGRSYLGRRERHRAHGALLRGEVLS